MVAADSAPAVRRLGEFLTSSQVLDALARALRLSQAERVHLYALASAAPRPARTYPRP